ncbi:hypothetical protein ABKA04_004556 [Annulohypoxylon sp. FPYF3050]
MVAISKISPRAVLITVVIITLIAVAMGHPTNETSLAGPTSVGNKAPAALEAPPPMTSPFNHSMGFVGQEDSESGVSAKQVAPHSKPCTSAGTKLASTASRIFFVTFIALAIAMILCK